MLNTKCLASLFTLIELLVVIAIIAIASDNNEKIIRMAQQLG